MRKNIETEINNMKYILVLKENLTDVTVLEKWQAGEIKLYNKLYKKFQERIENFGIKKMANEVKRLKEIQQNLEKYVILSNMMMETKQRKKNTNITIRFHIISMEFII